MKNNQAKICLVCVPGGHIYELYLLDGFWKKYDRFWITPKSPDTENLLASEKVYWGLKVRRNPVSYFKMLFFILKILRKEKPKLVVTTGSNLGAVAVHAARLLGIKSVFIELTARIEVLSLGAKLAAPFANHVLVQWEELAASCSKLKYVGRVL